MAATNSAAYRFRMSRLAFLLSNAAYDALGRPPEDDYVALLTAEKPLPQYWMHLARLAAYPRDNNTRSLFLSALDLDADFVMQVAAEHLIESNALDEPERRALSDVLAFIDWGKRDADGQRLLFFT